MLKDVRISGGAMQKDSLKSLNSSALGSEWFFDFNHQRLRSAAADSRLRVWWQLGKIAMWQVPEWQMRHILSSRRRLADRSHQALLSRPATADASHTKPYSGPVNSEDATNTRLPSGLSAGRGDRTCPPPRTVGQLDLRGG